MDLNESVEIKFVGKNNTILNVVSRGQFENVYKKKGWVLVNEDEKPVVKEQPLSEQPIEKIVEELKTTDEQEIKNLHTSKKKSTNVDKFNDKIIKE